MVSGNVLVFKDIKISLGLLITARKMHTLFRESLPRGVNNCKLLYIELTVSFLIGRKRTVNFRNQRLWRHLAANYTIIMSRTLKVTGNHVMYDRVAWFLRVIMSSSRALWCLPSVKKQNVTSFFFVQCIIKQWYIRFGFCDIQNNQVLGKGYQPQPSASADNPYRDLDYSRYHKSLTQ